MRALAAAALALAVAGFALPLAGYDPGGRAPDALEGAPEMTAEVRPAEAAARPAAAARHEAAGLRLALPGSGSGAAGDARALRELEAALLGLRAGIAEAEGEARAARHALRSEDADVKRLLASLVAAARARTDAPALHPAGPVAAARAAALLTASEAELRAGAEAASGRLRALAEAERRRDEGVTALAAGLEAAGEARAALRRAALARAEAPLGPPDPLAAFARESDTLSELAGRLAGPVSPAVEEAAELALVAAAEIVTSDAGAQTHVTRSSRNLPGGEPGFLLEMPVSGRVLRGFEAADGAGVKRPGLTLAAAPQSLVTAPAAGEVRYVGPFLDWNRVVAIAPAAGAIVILAGLAEVAIEPGEIVQAGAALGFLGGGEIGAQEFLMLRDKGDDAPGAETLYMELWRAGEPVDPEPWLGPSTDARNE